MGEGSFTANVQFPQSSPFPSRGKVLVFNGRLGGRPVLLAHVYGTEPVPTSYTLPFRIAPTKGAFGTTFTASLPSATGEWGFVTSIQMTLGRSFAYRGRRRSYLSSGRPAPAGFSKAPLPPAARQLRLRRPGDLDAGPDAYLQGERVVTILS